jgi:hypothetical protein
MPVDVRRQYCHQGSEHALDQDMRSPALPLLAIHLNAVRHTLGGSEPHAGRLVVAGKGAQAGAVCAMATHTPEVGGERRRTGTALDATSCPPPLPSWEFVRRRRRWGAGKVAQ